MREATAHLKTGGILIVCLAAAIASIHASPPNRDTHGDGPQAEFQMARVKYRTFGGGGSHGYFQPWWAIDYPLAEEHFFAALRRTTNIQIPDDDPLMHVFFDLDTSMGIPGDRHLRMSRNGQIFARLEGPPYWPGIYDDHRHLMVAVNFNSDMGDGWEHADDPNYPVPFTAQAYKFGINYIIYAMSH